MAPPQAAVDAARRGKEDAVVGRSNGGAESVHRNVAPAVMMEATAPPGGGIWENPGGQIELDRSEERRVLTGVAS